MPDGDPEAREATSPGADADGPGVPRERARLPRQLMVILGLALIGFATGIWAVTLFPNFPPVLNPAPITITLENSTPLDSVFVTVTPVTRSEDQLTVYLGTITAPSYSPYGYGYVEVEFPGSYQISCSAPVNCDFTPASINLPLIFARNSNHVQYTMTIRGARFGFSSNDESAIAQLPEVIDPRNEEEPTSLLYMEYDVRDANMYDWSVPAQSYSQEGFVFWDEQLYGSTEIQPVAATGTNPQVQARDNRNTFISGILLGVAGAATIAAIQEGLHMVFDKRDDDRPLKLAPRQPGTSS